MSYTTFAFALFVCITVAVYYLFPVKKYQWTVLLAASYFFYCFAAWRYVFFILFSTFTIWLAGLYLQKLAEKQKATIKAHRKEWSKDEKKVYKKKMHSKLVAILAITLIVNFGILGFLKYYNFLAGGLNQLFGGDPLPILTLFLPLGISFYTFQATGYLIDVYRETIQAEKNPFKFALFISFFPQTIQGPISQFAQLGEQLFTPHRPEYARFKYGLELILWGVFKKLIIADRAAVLINTVTADYSAYTGTTIFATALLYALQLYADFSAGIDISRGVAKILGIDMVLNFRQPYFSKSINEYWRRWNITLGVWMKNYIFYSLAMSDGFLNMSRKLKNTKFGQTKAGAHFAKVFPTSIASFIVFLAVGVWHGANSRYIAFGVWNGLIIMISILLKPVFEKMIAALRINAASFGWRLFQMIRTFVLVLVGYYFDIGPNFKGAMDMMRLSIVDQHAHTGMHELLNLGLGEKDFAAILFGMIVIWVISIRLEKTGIETPGELIGKRRAWVQWILLFLTVIIIIALGRYGPGYDPAEFVYMQF